jgi:hypothetical protein
MKALTVVLPPLVPSQLHFQAELGSELPGDRTFRGQT